ncbi:hypothetical protein A0128_08745 [Leptospira tipperaryensis]|uniref:Uncharacterized protein n=1 Tax=Leptospira tipperaryensis TaxID=2564040 RepID=A0A1D7UWG0_9LEPT|nr:hypothetical protein A0128_08745 [Leptospira tipperaryensis]
MPGKFFPGIFFRTLKTDLRTYDKLCEKNSICKKKDFVIEGCFANLPASSPPPPNEGGDRMFQSRRRNYDIRCKSRAPRPDFGWRGGWWKARETFLYHKILILSRHILYL